MEKQLDMSTTPPPAPVMTIPNNAINGQCGNGRLDEGEECDYAMAGSQECCSRTCRTLAAQTPCQGGVGVCTGRINTNNTNDTNTSSISMSSAVCVTRQAVCSAYDGAVLSVQATSISVRGPFALCRPEEEEESTTTLDALLPAAMVPQLTCSIACLGTTTTSSSSSSSSSSNTTTSNVCLALSRFANVDGRAPDGLPCVEAASRQPGVCSAGQCQPALCSRQRCNNHGQCVLNNNLITNTTNINMNNNLGFMGNPVECRCDEGWTGPFCQLALNTSSTQTLRLPGETGNPASGLDIDQFDANNRLIAGLVIGCVFGAILLAAIVALCCRWRRRRHQRKQPLPLLAATPPTTNDNNLNNNDNNYGNLYAPPQTTLLPSIPATTQPPPHIVRIASPDSLNLMNAVMAAGTATTQPPHQQSPHQQSPHQQPPHQQSHLPHQQSRSPPASFETASQMSLSPPVGQSYDTLSPLATTLPPAAAAYPIPSTSTSVSASHPAYFRASFTYIPRMHDEIQLLPGDLIYLIKSYDDGWSKGYNLRTGREGVFPMSFVKVLDSESGNTNSGGKGKKKVSVTVKEVRETTK